MIDYLLLAVIVACTFFLARVGLEHLFRVAPVDDVRAKMASLKKAASAVKRTPKGFLDDPRSQIMMLLGAMSLGLLSVGSGFILQAVVLGALMGLGVAYGSDVFKKRVNKLRRLKDIIHLYEVVDLLTTKCSYSLYDALGIAQTLLPTISGPIRKCLHVWPAGAGRALDALGDDLDSPEAQVLVSVLQSAQESGAERLAGVLSEEALRIEELRRKAVEVALENRPIIQNLYVNLPVAVALGMFVGPLVFDLLQVLAGTKAPLLH